MKAVRIRVAQRVLHQRCIRPDRVIGDRIVMDDQEQDAGVAGAPSQYEIFSERPVLVKSPVEVDQVASLPEVEIAVETHECGCRDRLECFRIGPEDRLSPVRHDGNTHACRSRGRVRLKRERTIPTYHGTYWPDQRPRRHGAANPSEHYAQDGPGNKTFMATESPNPCCTGSGRSSARRGS